MKELFDFLKHYGILPLVYGAGIFSLGLFALSLVPTLNWVPKMFLLFVLTH